MQSSSFSFIYEPESMTTYLDKASFLYLAKREANYDGKSRIHRVLRRTPSPGYSRSPADALRTPLIALGEFEGQSNM